MIAGELFVTLAPRWQYQMTCGKIATALNNWTIDGGLGQVAMGLGIVFSEADSVIPDMVRAAVETLARALDTSDHFTDSQDK
ncbi:MAG: hypothetical protein HC890_08500 [Chloroflexaceae bacterium]|nr:hypothetical protein [Chloroflexaceae bacterium]